MDGQLAFYTHGAHSFSCFLPDFLLPGPLAYAHRTDSLVTVNSAHSLQVFRYQTLAVVGGAGRDTGKRFTVSVRYVNLILQYTFLGKHFLFHLSVSEFPKNMARS